MIVVPHETMHLEVAACHSCGDDTPVMLMVLSAINRVEPCDSDDKIMSTALGLCARCGTDFVEAVGQFMNASVHDPDFGPARPSDAARNN